MHMHRVRERLIEHWEVIDLHGLLAQLTDRDTEVAHVAPAQIASFQRVYMATIANNAAQIGVSLARRDPLARSRTRSPSSWYLGVVRSVGGGTIRTTTYGRSTMELGTELNDGHGYPPDNDERASP